MAKIFSSCFAEDGVILLLPQVRVRFAVAPADWIDWSFVVAPRIMCGADRVMTFGIDPEGRPTKTA